MKLLVVGRVAFVVVQQLLEVVFAARVYRPLGWFRATI